MKSLLVMSFLFLGFTANAGVIELTVESTNPLHSCYGGAGPHLDHSLITDANAEAQRQCEVDYNGEILRVTNVEVTRTTQYPTSCSYQVATVTVQCDYARR